MNLATWDETCDSHYPARSEAFNTKIGLSIGAVTGAVPYAEFRAVCGNDRERLEQKRSQH